MIRILLLFMCIEPEISLHTSCPFATCVGRDDSAYPAAVVTIQAAIRGFLGRKRAWAEYFSRLAMEHAGAKEVLRSTTLYSVG